MLYDLLTSCNTIAVTNEKLYNYLSRPNSIMNSMNSKGIFDGFEASKQRYNKLLDEDLKRLTIIEMLNSYVYLYKKFRKFEIAKEILCQYKADYKTYKKLIKSPKLKLKYFLLAHYPKLLTLKK